MIYGSDWSLGLADRLTAVNGLDVSENLPDSGLVVFDAFDRLVDL